MIIPKSTKKYMVKTPGGRTVEHFKKERPSHAFCRVCGAKLNRPKINVKKFKNLPKTKKRPQRPFPDLCSRCMREHFKDKVR